MKGGVAPNEPKRCSNEVGFVVPMPILPPNSVMIESPSRPELSAHLAIWFCVPEPEASGCTEPAESVCAPESDCAALAVFPAWRSKSARRESCPPHPASLAACWCRGLDCRLQSTASALDLCH